MGIPLLRILNKIAEYDYPNDASDALYCSALATLPALESVELSNRGLDTRPDDESIRSGRSRAPGETIARMVPSLRSGQSLLVVSLSHPRSLSSNSERIHGRHGSHQAQLLVLFFFC
jgi:hypothetical protein